MSALHARHTLASALPRTLCPEAKRHLHRAAHALHAGDAATAARELRHAEAAQEMDQRVRDALAVGWTALRASNARRPEMEAA